MSQLFEDLKDGLQEALLYENGQGKGRKVTYVIAPLQKYSSEEIKSIRNRAGMTQSVFADYMGVSQKTVEAWELGRTHPTGPAYRLLTILNNGDFDKIGLAKVKNQ